MGRIGWIRKNMKYRVQVGSGGAGSYMTGKSDIQFQFI